MSISNCFSAISKCFWSYDDQQIDNLPPSDRKTTGFRPLQELPSHVKKEIQFSASSNSSTPIKRSETVSILSCKTLLKQWSKSGDEQTLINTILDLCDTNLTREQLDHLKKAPLRNLKVIAVLLKSNEQNEVFSKYEKLSVSDINRTINFALSGYRACFQERNNVLTVDLYPTDDSRPTVKEKTL